MISKSTQSFCVHTVILYFLSSAMIFTSKIHIGVVQCSDPVPHRKKRNPLSLSLLPLTHIVLLFSSVRIPFKVSVKCGTLAPDPPLPSLAICWGGALLQPPTRQPHLQIPSHSRELPQQLRKLFGRSLGDLLLYTCSCALLLAHVQTAAEHNCSRTCS